MKRRNIQQEILSLLRVGEDYKSSISRKLACDFASSSRAIDALVKKGLIEASSEVDAEGGKIFYKIKEKS